VLKKIIVSACIAGIGIFVSCSNLNDSSSLGGEIIINSDPNRIDFNKSFEYFDTLSVLNQYSVVEPADTTIGSGSAIVGKNSSKTVRAVLGFAHDSTFRYKHRGRTLRSTVVRIGAEPLKINGTTTKVLSSINVLLYNASLMPRQLDTLIARKTIKNKLTTDTNMFSDTLNPLTSVSIDSTLKSYRKEDSGTYFIKLVVTSDDTLFELRAKPRLILIYDSLGTTILDSITSEFRTNVQFDAPAIKTAYDTLPVSSVYSGRYAVFKLDLKSLWTEMAKRPGFTTILSVPLIISGQSLVATDTVEKKYYYYISPKLFANPKEIKDSMIVKNATGKIGSKQYLDTVAAEIFFRPLSNNKPDAAYLYLRSYDIANTYSDRSIRWSNPIITGVFTNNQ
jgi:hypothetical protein